MKNQATDRKYLQTAYLTKDLSSIYKELPKIYNWKNGQKTWKRYFIKKNIQMASKCMKRCSTSLNIKERKTPQQDTTIHPLECLEKFCFVLFCFGCIGSSLLRAGFLYLCRAGALLRCGVWASHCGGFSCVERMGSRRAGFSSCDLRALEHR